MKKILRMVNERLARFFARHTAHRFVTRPFLESPDLGFLTTAIDFDCFRRTLIPVPLPLNKKDRYLIIAPHQDDESIGVGGTMARLASINAQQKVLFVTNGAQGGKDVDSSKSVYIRNAEAKAALQLIGCDCTFSTMCNIHPEPDKETIRWLREEIIQFSPDVVMIPWILDAPEKHKLVNHLFALACSTGISGNIEVWGYQVHSGIIANAYVDISTVLELKREMISCYKSQLALRNYDFLAACLAGWNSRLIKSERDKEKYCELFFTLPATEYCSLIRQLFDNDLHRIYSSKSLRRCMTELIEVCN